MPVPNSIDDLDTTPANNSPPGSESAKGNIDNYLRTAFAFIKQTWAAVVAAKAIADGALPKTGGSMSGAIAMQSNKLTGLPYADSAGDAVSREYGDIRYMQRNVGSNITGEFNFLTRQYFQIASPYNITLGYGQGQIAGFLGAFQSGTQVGFSNSAGAAILVIGQNGALSTPQLGDIATAIDARVPKASQIFHGSAVAEFGAVYYGNGGSGPLDLPSPWVVVGMRATDGYLLYLRGIWLRTP